MSAGSEAAERARTLRAVLDECERVLADKDADPERRAVAQKWHDRLGGIGRPHENAYHLGGGGGFHVHHSGGGQFLADDLRYEGWGRES